MYYKDLEVWKEARILVKEVYELTSKFPKTEIYGLTSQINRCVVSVPSNIAEGCTRFSDKDTKKFLDIALGSIAELDTQLILAEDLGFTTYNENLEKHIKKSKCVITRTEKIRRNILYHVKNLTSYRLNVLSSSTINNQRKENKND